MQFKTKNIFVFLATVYFSCCAQGNAADFSHAKQIFVPPTYIRRDLDALGTNNWSFPGLNPHTGASTITSPAQGANAEIDLANFLNKNNTSPLSGALNSIGSIQSRVSSLIHSGQLDQAEDMARAGLKNFPTSSILKNQFATITATEAQLFLKNQDYDQAGKKARECLVADPKNKAAKNIINKVLQTQGLDPYTAEAHVTAGDTLSAEGRLLEASVEYKLALDIKPNAAAHVGLGNLAIGKGQVSEANRQFERALAIDPNSALAYRQRGALRYVLKDAVGANSDFSKAVALAPNDQLACDALIGLWKQQVASNPNSANSHLGLARAYMQTNNLEAARNEYKTVVSIDPNNPALPAARASFKLALAKQEADQCMQAAKTLVGQGALGEAHQKLIEAVSYCPTDPDVLLYHAKVCEMMGLSADAHDAYMNVLKADPKNLEAATRLKSISIPFAQPLNPQPPLELSAPPPVAPARRMEFSSGVDPNAMQAVPQALPQALPQSLPQTAPPEAMPQENMQGAPLKSPIPKTQSYIPAPIGNAYCDLNQNLSIGQPAQVTMLSNFGSCVRALMLIEKQLLQTSGKNAETAYF